MTKGDQAFVSQHIGDMENLETSCFHGEIRLHLENILMTRPEVVAHDLHPDYMTSEIAAQVAKERSLPAVAVQHHAAHAHSVLAENRHAGQALCLALDGTGFGENRSLWGGELLLMDTRTTDYKRLAHFSPLRLPGGETAVREPWRIAQAALFDLGLREPSAAWPWLPEHQAASRIVGQMLQNGVNCPATSSCGRLFDAVAALLGLCLTTTYEGQAAIRMEAAQDMAETSSYPCPMRSGPGPVQLNVEALFRAALEDKGNGIPTGDIARRLHRGLVDGLAALAAHFSRSTGIRTVALSGGAMQNLTLAMELPARLSDRGLIPLVHTQIPPNDACISLGQAVYARLWLRERTQA